MFDLEKAISDWRREMFRAGIKDPEVLVELESHLRDEVSQQTRAGADAHVAFEDAVLRIGHAAALQKEFGKAGPLRRMTAWTSRATLTLAGVPNHYLETNMNSDSSNPEPGWATYLRSTAVLAPAAILLLLVSVYVTPQLQFLCEKSNFAGLLNVSGWFVRLYRSDLWLMSFCKDHLVIILLAVLISIGWLEWRSTGWPRYRRSVLGTAAFLLNVAVLLSLAILFLTATLVGCALSHQIK